MKPRERGRTIYSTGPGGATKPPVPAREPSSAAETALSRQRPVLRRETGGRGGKTVTVVDRLRLSPEQALALLKDLKRRCGAGGTLRDGVAPGGGRVAILELQGDHVATLRRELGALGMTVGGERE